ncbi:MAG TPA: Hpt domain-containing protein [Noviherbaspirillum sp.]|nr:Hpt domain-containing protein [Noviherbaspirillum sp.]
MTSSSSFASQSVRHNFDTGPLSWVIGEIREALNRSKVAIHEAITQDVDEQATSIRHAKSYLHQAHGALQIIDVDGVAIITETVEDLFDRIDTSQLELTSKLAVAIGNSYQALVEYLEELLSGMSHQPVRLFPYYRALLEVRGAERIHPADLFFPNLAIRPQLPGASAIASASAAKYTSLRQCFERALLPFLKSTHRNIELANAAVMRDVVSQIESMQDNPQAHVFWWVMHGLAEAVADGKIQNEIYVKQLFARINLQIRRLCQGSPSIAERLLRDALFFIAKASDPSPRVREIRTAYRLDGLVPDDYEKERYGQIDTDALAQAKERLAQAKNMWNRIAGGDASVAEVFERDMHFLADAGSKLNSPPLSKLLREMKGIARHAAHAKPGDILGLEMATGLLFIENSLAHIGHLSDNFAERADAMTARLLAVVAGEKPAQALQWIDDMSREAQHRQTMSALAGEMQASLRQVEKMLDEYFRDPSQSNALDQLDTTLHQIEGALAVLEQDDAMRTIQHTRAAVQRFLSSEQGGAPDQEDFQQVAQNVGALSFFIETLQLPSESAKNRFSFDETQGIFRANLIEQASQNEVEPDACYLTPDAAQNLSEPLPDATPPVISTVEDELAFHQKQSAELAMSLKAQPDNSMLQERLRESLEQIRLDAALIDNPDANDRAKTGINLLERPDFSASKDALADIMAATTLASPLAQPLPVRVAPATDEAVDAELLEIFLGEAEEVLETVRKTIPESRSEPHNQEHLTTLRRSFHTLKGSGRMVGLVSIGEAAWSIEQVLNLRLSESRNGDAELYNLLDKAVDILAAWVLDLQTKGRSDRTSSALVSAAERVKAGGKFFWEDESDEADKTIFALDASIDVVPLTPEMQVAEIVPQVDVSDPEEHSDLSPDMTVVTTESSDGSDLVDTPWASTELPQVEEFELSDADLAMFEASNITTLATSKKHSMATAESFPEITPPLVSIADVIEFPSMQTVEATLSDTVRRIGDLEISVPLHNIYLSETDELVRLLAQDIAEWRHEPERPVNIQAVHAAHSLAGSSATVGFNSLQEVAHALEMVLQFLIRKPVRLMSHEFDTLEQSVERLKLMLQKFALGEMPVHEREYARLLASLQKDIESRAEMHVETFLTTLPELEGEAAPSDVLESSYALTSELPELAPIDAAHSAVKDDAGEKGGAYLGTEDTQDRQSASLALPESTISGERDISVDSTMMLTDELDADLLPVFLEEGRDIFPPLGTALREWQEQPGNIGLPQSMLRSLHTLKGSARMAGAMRLGQHLHDMESRIENIMRLGAPAVLPIENLLLRYDQGLQMFEHLQYPQAATQMAEIEPVADEQVEKHRSGEADSPDHESVALTPLNPVQSGRQAPIKLPAAHALATPARVAPTVRVRAEILDRLVNQAGEVSISRSKLENEVGTLRQSLSELTENVARLRDQLREIEMQAETQITSRMAQSGEREFDPLEFDRFTRLQELTRMMAESVDDVGSVHHNLSRTLDSAVSDLTAQARLTRDLQQDLMRVRMVQFGSISERLFRVTRQAAKEVDKRVSLDIRGSAVEIDRGVLEKMTGPFEHLLRNAIVHGIESREIRRAAGKSETGELLVDVRQEGNEVVIQFSDDGQGLDIARIRDKAKRVGLLTDDDGMSDAAAAELIFHSGFSTADEITELAGRGVGMDVVRSEAAVLGGRVSICSEPGQGAHFTVHLPLTLAVTQVVLLSTGGKTYAVPSVLVEQVQQLKTNALAAAYNDGVVAWQGQQVPLYYLSALLGDTKVSPVSQHYSPLVILKSGNDRVALHVDEIFGNREVVVKNIGPQLARMIGVAGATVLGSGDIVLILNPVPLAQRAVQGALRAPRLTQSGAPASIGAVADLQEPAESKAKPVQGLRTQNIVMVVDDSLTVRRVTQRLLTREGYQVVLAKDGVDALEQLQSLTPDIMLVDIEMPRMDGFDLTRNVRDDERTRQIPILMITSRTAAKHRNYALELGVNEYLGKPYQEEQLLALIAGFLKKDVSTS